MRVTLDQDQWEVGIEATIGDVLADVSERAQARSRIVTSLRLDQRVISDRDLHAEFLRETSGHFTRLTAVSQSMHDLMESAKQMAARYALDLWLGKLADYLELVEGGRPSKLTGENGRPLSEWVRELLDARAGRDIVLMADLLEYEILPRLAQVKG